MTTVDINNVHLYMDGYLRANLDLAKIRVKKNWDMIGLYSGDEGDGKTNKAFQDALYMDPSFNINRVVFNALQFEDVVDQAPPETAIVWDEADDLGGHWADKMLIAIKRKFKRIRKKRLYIFLVTPTIFDLAKYFVVSRTLYLIHVYSDGLERGYFRFYGKKAKRMLYIRGRKEWNMDAWSPDFKGRFTKLPDNFPIDMSPNGEYEFKKDEATKALVGANQIYERTDTLRRIAKWLYNEKKIPTSEMVDPFGVSLRTIQYYVAKKVDDDEKAGDVPVSGAREGAIRREDLPVFSETIEARP